MTGLQTPVAFFIFNRPEQTKQSLAAIALVKPAILLVVADAARFEEEKILVEQTRLVLQSIDWPCTIHTNFASQNMGCKNRVSSGLDWVFSLVDQAIIIEDDCIPDPSFFEFCTAMLLRYASDESVAHVSGNRFFTAHITIDGDYYFSKYPHIWGWATWKRAWKNYDVGMKQWSKSKYQLLQKMVGHDKNQYQYWNTTLDSAHNNMVDTWDYQWLFTIWCKGQKAITPLSNLVKNIGFGPDATHTKDAESSLANLKITSLHTFHHTASPDINLLADDETFYTSFSNYSSKKNAIPVSDWYETLKRMKNWIRKVLRRWLISFV